MAMMPMQHPMIRNKDMTLAITFIECLRLQMFTGLLSHPMSNVEAMNKHTTDFTKVRISTSSQLAFPCPLSGWFVVRVMV
jgi:hypothetical protein